MYADGCCLERVLTMFESWEVAPFKWKISPRAALWGALLWALVAGVVIGLLWAGRLRLDLLNVVSLTILLGGAILLAFRFALQPSRRLPPSV
ncbi:hypothetical protein SBA1_550089 [Candidatus Sulfotelmatobacter kueseliae]|uniref:Uncharacterized protein n=1 Tax=Candidatus Sulfotelmatobacter kueseliae TaxID=2042962 RepID=A0A2U3KYG1_9BACT|nr:hypothetical protein SBA1_550089 [Candidatus Sulfotelmatobacter kueseliae]